MAVHEKDRKILVALRKCAPAVLAALWAAPFIHYGSTKRAVSDRTDAVCVAGGGIDGGAGRPALPNGWTNGIPVGRDVPVAPTAAVSDGAAVDARECVRVSWTSGRSCEITWPLGFTFTEDVSDSLRTYSVGVVPYDPGGTFDWGGAAAVQDGGAAVRARASATSAAVSCGCASGEGRTLAFNCTAECPCGGGCSVSGAYVLEGASFAVTGGVCRCGFDDPAPWRGDSCSCGGGLGCSCQVCVCRGADFGPGLSVAFGHEVVIFEESYMDAPGVWRPRRSTRTTLSVSACGGPEGGRLALAAKGLERLAPVVCGPFVLPPSLELAAGETYSAEFLCEAGAESAAANDVAVEGTFVENGTGRTFTSRAALTVVRVEIRATVDPPDTSAGRLNRHTFGVCERIDLVQSPTSPMIVWTDVDSDVRQSGGSVRYGIPARVCENPLRAECAGTTYVPCLTVLAPQSVSAVFAEEVSWGSVVMYGAGMGQAGGIGMLLDLYVHPMNVSFTGIQIQEVPSFTYDASGYFLNRYFAGGFGHTGGLWGAGAGNWLDVRPDHRFARDTAAYHALIPWLTPDGRVTDDPAYSWTHGYVYIDNPFGWRPLPPREDDSFCRRFATDVRDEIMLDRDGTVGVRKLYKEVMRTTNGVVRLNGVRVR